MSAHLPTFDTASQPWPTSIVLAAGSSRSGSAWLGRSQKDGLPSRLRGVAWRLRLKASNSRTGGAARLLPLQIGSKCETEEDWGRDRRGNKKPRLPRGRERG